MIVGIVGKANVGKSTFFKALTLADIEIANYPFATIKPNHGVGFVKIESIAKELGREPNPREGFYRDGWRFVPVNVIDVAGLVPGAHEGKGLGLQFLNDLNQANVLIHVIDASGGTNEKGETVEVGSNDPANDIKFLEIELDHWYLDILKKGWDKFLRHLQSEHLNAAQAITNQMSGIGVTEEIAKECIKGLPEKLASWSSEDQMKCASLLRQKTKPMIIAANKTDMPVAQENFERLVKKFPDHVIVKVSAESELALKEADSASLIDYVPGSSTFTIKDPSKLSEKQSKALEFIKSIIEKNGSTGLQECLNKAVFDVLKYKAISPGGVSNLADSDGNVLPDCFLMKPDATALDFAYRLHTDFGKNFIKAIDVKKKMPIGKDHVLKHRDVVEIVAKK